jgi:hypothetical protein
MWGHDIINMSSFVITNVNTPNPIDVKKFIANRQFLGLTWGRSLSLSLSQKKKEASDYNYINQIVYKTKVDRNNREKRYVKTIIIFRTISAAYSNELPKFCLENRPFGEYRIFNLLKVLCFKISILQNCM